MTQVKDIHLPDIALNSDYEKYRLNLKSGQHDPPEQSVGMKIFDEASKVLGVVDLASLVLTTNPFTVIFYLVFESISIGLDVYAHKIQRDKYRQYYKSYKF